MSEESATRIKRLQGYASADPDNLSLRADLADELIQVNKSSEALVHIEHALALSPEHPQFRFRRAVALRRSGRTDDAVKVLDELIAGGAGDPAVFFERADLAFQLREFEGCVRYAKRVLESPEYRKAFRQADLLYVRGLHYLGRLDEAIAHAEASLAEDPRNGDISAALATLYLDAERLQDAARLYESGARTGPLAPELQCVGGYLALAEEKSQIAQQRFSETLAARPKDGRALLGAGLANAVAGDLSRAIELLERAATAMPDHLGTLNALAWMQLQGGQLDAADETLKRAQAIDDTFAESYGAQSVVAAMRGNRAGAQELMRTALKLDRNCFSAAYASMLLQHGVASQATLQSALEFLSRQSAPAGGSMKAAVLRLAKGTPGKAPANNRR